MGVLTTLCQVYYLGAMPRKSQIQNIRRHKQAGKKLKLSTSHLLSLIIIDEEIIGYSQNKNYLEWL
jgi:hypothetical protein